MKLKTWIPTLLVAGSTLLAGCGSSNTWDDIGGQPGNPSGPVIPLAPVAVDDLYSTDEGQSFTLTAAQGVLANDQLNTTVPAAVTVAFPATTTQGGSISNGANSGSFTYTPALGFVGTDTFTYTVDNGFGDDSATVSIVVDAAVITQGYFVDSATGSDATGDFQTGSPFATIQGAVTAAPVNADVIVRPGNYSGAVTLKNGQRLLGAGSALVNAQGVVRPVLTGPVVLADGNTLDFLRVQGTNGNAIDGDGQNGGTITNCEITNTTNLGSGVHIRSVNGTWRVENNTITNVAGIGIDLDTQSNDVTTAFINNNTITGSTYNAMAFVSSDASQLKVQANNNVMTGNQDGYTFEVIAGGTSTASFQILGNQNDDTYRIRVVSTAPTAAINVEQLSQLVALNNNLGVVTTGGGGNMPATEIPANSIEF